jgi:hypothetical protein
VVHTKPETFLSSMFFGQEETISFPKWDSRNEQL